MPGPFSCDTSVVLGSATFDGSTILAKNSDRSPNEAQPLGHYPRQQHAAGSMVRCQYIEIPQVEETWETIGSRPCWLWGFEMGVNEWGVAIGNEAVMTREPFEAKSLNGMDIVRLALERATNASAAVAIIGELIETYGQGGSCEEFSDRTYHNSFIVADPISAVIVETAGHRWATQQVRDRAAIGNMLTIDSPDATSPGLREHAAGEGWFSGEFSFAEAYRDPAVDLAPRACRLDRARAILGGYDHKVTVTDMMNVLRDHAEGDLPTTGAALPTLCMHANPLFPGETAASMVVHLRPGQPRELTATVWTAFGSPCLSLFRPVYPYAVGLPAELNVGASTYGEDAPWWRFERMQRLVAGSPEIAGEVRAAFAPVQEQFFAMAAEAEQDARAEIDAGDRGTALARLRACVDQTTDLALATADRLVAAFSEAANDHRNQEMSAFWAELNDKAGLKSPGLAEIA